MWHLPIPSKGQSLKIALLLAISFYYYLVWIESLIKEYGALMFVVTKVICRLVSRSSQIRHMFKCNAKV